MRLEEVLIHFHPDPRRLERAHRAVLGDLEGLAAQLVA
jgi:hypothetical protein